MTVVQRLTKKFLPSTLIIAGVKHMDKGVFYGNESRNSKIPEH